MSVDSTTRWLIGLCISSYYDLPYEAFNPNASTDYLSLQLWNGTQVGVPFQIAGWKEECSSNLSLDLELSTAVVVSESVDSLMAKSEQLVYYIVGAVVAVFAIFCLVYFINMCCQVTCSNKHSTELEKLTNEIVTQRTALINLLQVGMV